MKDTTGIAKGKVTTSRKSKTHNREWKTRPITVCEC